MGGGLLGSRNTLLCGAVLWLGFGQSLAQGSPSAGKDAEYFQAALTAQAAENWSQAQSNFERIQPGFAEFPSVFLENQKISYRSKNWPRFFSQVQIYEMVFAPRFACPQLYLLHSFALIRNCQFDLAEKALQATEKSAASTLTACASPIAPADLKKKIAELRSFLKVKQQARYGKSAETASAKVSAAPRRQWPLDKKLLEKLAEIPLGEGLAFVAVKTKNLCEAPKGK